MEHSSKNPEGPVAPVLATERSRYVKYVASFYHERFCKSTTFYMAWFEESSFAEKDKFYRMAGARKALAGYKKRC